MTKPKRYWQALLISLFLASFTNLAAYPATNEDNLLEWAEQAQRIREKKDRLESCLRILAHANEEKGDLDQAIGYYERLSRISPDDFDLLEKLGDLYVTQNIMEKAAKVYEKAYTAYTEDTHKKAEIAGKWLKALLQFGDKKEQWCSWKQECTLSVNVPEYSLEQLPHIFEELDEWQLALEASDYVLERKPESISLLRQRIRILTKLGRIKDALCLCDCNLSKETKASDRVWSLRLLAKIVRSYYETERDNIEETLEKACPLTKSLFLHLTGKTEEAIRILEGLKSEKGDAFCSYILGFLYKQIDKSGDAMNAFETYLKEEKHDGVQWLLGEMYWETGEKDKALTCWKELTKQGSDYSVGSNLTHLGLILKEYGEYDQAIPFLEKATRRYRDGFWNKMHYARTLYEIGRTEEGLSMYSTALSDVWEGHIAHLNQLSEKMYFTIEKVESIQEAERYLQNILEKNPMQTWIQMALALLHLRSGKIEKARKEFEMIIQESTEEKAAIFALEKVAFCLFLEGKLESTITTYQTLMREGNLNDWQEATTYLKLGLICQFWEKADYARAIGYYKKALQVSPEAWTANDALYRMGQCYWLMGESHRYEALDAFKLLPVKYPGSEYRISTRIKIALLEKCTQEERDLYRKAEELWLSGNWEQAVDILQELTFSPEPGFATEAALFQLHHIHKRVLGNQEKAKQIRNQLTELFPKGMLAKELHEEKENDFFNNFQVAFCSGTEYRIPLERQSCFPQSSWIAMLWFQTRQIFPQPEITIDWYTPFNELYISSKNRVNPTGTASRGIYVMDYLPAIITGPWHVKVFFDDIPVGEFPFSIEKYEAQE